MIYVLSGLLTGGVLTAICWPLFSRKDSLESAVLEETEWDLLRRKKEVVLGNIQDLDFEYQCGKLSHEDYSKVRDELTAEAAEVLSAQDAIEASLDLDALIRREVSARKEARRDQQDKQDKKDQTVPSSICKTCGHPNPNDNKFCAECGSQLGA